MNLYLLNAASDSLVDYLPIVMQIFLAIGIVAIMMGGSHLLGPKRKTKDKLANFESGIKAIGNARQPMAIKYFLVAILFVLFDVEVIFFYPYAVNFKAFAADPETAQQTFLAVVMFVAFFVIGFTYVIKKGGLDWED